jgi:hypothetical protein
MKKHTHLPLTYTHRGHVIEQGGAEGGWYITTPASLHNPDFDRDVEADYHVATLEEAREFINGYELGD